jgi:hypothetical protein
MVGKRTTTRGEGRLEMEMQEKEDPKRRPRSRKLINMGKEVILFFC